MEKEIKKFHLYRHLITQEERENYPSNYTDYHSHLISIEMLNGGDKWSSNVMAIQPCDLRFYIKKMQDRIDDAYNKK